ncbi:MAG TPA: cation-translocating P-type ATPase C-terminal domain-containing protein, partial [Ilumatobacteraceae bacterium]|nr:cation-translocating P-type ATPase C-terminal domain-containing protein [Ilumatobacteraceae bacterium]
EDQARALTFTALLASQPILLLSMRSPERPLWRSVQPWTRTLTIVIAALAVTTPAVVYVPPLAELLHLAAFPAPWWLVVIATASTAAWSEPLKLRSPAADRGREGSG